MTNFDLRGGAQPYKVHLFCYTETNRPIYFPQNTPIALTLTRPPNTFTVHTMNINADNVDIK